MQCPPNWQSFIEAIPQEVWILINANLLLVAFLLAENLGESFGKALFNLTH